MEYLNIQLEYIINFRVVYYINKIEEQINNLYNSYEIKIINILYCFQYHLYH